MNLHQQLLIEAIRKADRSAALNHLRDWASQNGYDRVLADVLEPALTQIGEEWRSFETFTLAQAYIAGRVAEDMLAEIASHSNPPQKPEISKGPVVIGNAEDDFHGLGRRMVGIFLRADNWNVIDLGNDVLADSFVDKAVETGARVIGVSAMMLTTARNIKRVRDEIDRRNLSGRLQLAVGGAVFRIMPHVVEEVGGDGSAGNALGSSKLFDELWRRSLESERQP